MLIAEVFRVISENSNRVAPREFLEYMQAADSAACIGGNNSAGLYPKDSHVRSPRAQIAIWSAWRNSSSCGVRSNFAVGTMRVRDDSNSGIIGSSSPD